MSATDANIKTLLGGQLTDRITDQKKHKPLLLALTARDVKGALEFGREFTKLADTVHRQFQLALADCQFERDVCTLFKPRNFPIIYFFKGGKVYEYHVDSVTQDLLLGFLSSDNYLRQSSVKEEDADEFIRGAIGIGGGFVDRMYNTHGKAVETYL